MKKAIALVVSWCFYVCGDATSRCMFDGTGWLYPVYNCLMLASVAVQDWGGSGPWEPAPFTGARNDE